MTTTFGFSILILLLNMQEPRANPDLPKRLDPDQRLALSVLLEDKPGWRVATLQDRKSVAPYGLSSYDTTHHPYFAEADLNLDGKSDFAVTITKNGAFWIYWFAQTATGYSKPLFVTAFSKLNNYVLGADRGRLLIGEPETDNVALFQWDNTKRKLVLQ